MRKLSLFLVLALLLTSVIMPASALTISGENEFPIVDEKITISAWGSQFADRDYDTCLMTTALEELTNVHIDWQLFPAGSDGNEMFNLLIAGEEYPDILFGIWPRPEQIEMAIEGNVIIPLNDLIANHGPNYRAALEANPAYESMLTASDGNIYTFMYTDTGVHKDSEYKMHYYKPWLEKLGMEAPTTPEEFKAYLIAIRDNDVNGNGDATDEIPLMGFNKGRKTDPICFLMNPFELYTDSFFYITDDGKINFTATSDGFRKGLAYIADLYAEGLIAEETYIQDETQFRALLNKAPEEMVIGVAPNWHLAGLIDAKVMPWTAYEPLAPLKGDYQQSAARFGGNFNLMGMISSQCENPEAAFKILDYLIGEEGLYLGFYGVEGDSYEWVDEPSYYGTEKSVRRLKTDVETLWNSGSFPRYDQAAARYATTMDPTLIDATDNTYVLLHPAQVYEPYYVNHNTPDVVWCTDTSLVQSYTEQKAMFEEYIRTINTQFIMGAMDVNDDAVWNGYLADLEGMGLPGYIDTLAAYYGLE